MSVRWPRLVAALLGLLWFLQIGGGPTLNPANVTWLLTGDWLQHWLGWMMFRDEPWTFPLGTLTSGLYPVGTTIGFTDSNPIVSVLLKPFALALPADFQFIGLWLALCFMFQGYMGALLASAVTKEPGEQALGGYLMVLTPVLVGRVWHDTLCAHAILLGLMYLGLRDYPDARSVRRGAAWAAAGVLLASGVHPYLAVMSLVLALGVYVRFWFAGLASRVQAGAMALVTTAGMVGVFALFGYFSGVSVNAWGFGRYSADLLTFVTPTTYSRLLPEVLLRDGQVEGFAFLGLGGLVAAGVAFVAVVQRRSVNLGGRWPTVFAGLLMGIFALSSDVTVAGRSVLSLQWLYDFMMPVASVFRSTGRFMWPLHYLVLLVGVWGVTRVFGSARWKAGTVALAVVVGLQATDLRVSATIFAPKQFREPPLRNLPVSTASYRHLALVPMQVLGVCGEPIDERRVYRYLWQASRLKLTYNSGVVARVADARVRETCAALEGTINARALDPTTIYVVADDRLAAFKETGAMCGRFDGDWICVSKDSDERFRTFLGTGKVIDQSGR